MDEPARMQLHDLAAVKRCCEDGAAYLDRLIASPGALSPHTLWKLRTHRQRLREAMATAEQTAQAIKDEWHDGTGGPR